MPERVDRLRLGVRVLLSAERRRRGVRPDARALARRLGRDAALNGRRHFFRMGAARALKRCRRGSVTVPRPCRLYVLVIVSERVDVRRELIVADGTGIRQLRRLGARRFRCGNRILMPDNAREIRRRIAVPAGTDIRHQIACAGVFHAGTFGIIVNVFFLGRRCRIADRRRVCEGTTFQPNRIAIKLYR